MTLADLVQRQREKVVNSQKEKIDWTARRDKWLLELQKLYTVIQTWLHENGLESDAFERFEVEIEEEDLGRYTATGLRVRFGPALVTFRPFASVLIGACGRVDVYSDVPQTQRVRLVAEVTKHLATKDDRPVHEREWSWIVYPRGAHDENFSLCEKGLAKALALVLGERE